MSSNTSNPKSSTQTTGRAVLGRKAVLHQANSMHYHEKNAKMAEILGASTKPTSPQQDADSDDEPGFQWIEKPEADKRRSADSDWEKIEHPKDHIMIESSPEKRSDTPKPPVDGTSTRSVQRSGVGFIPAPRQDSALRESSRVYYTQSRFPNVPQPVLAKTEELKGVLHSIDPVQKAGSRNHPTYD